MNMKKKTKPVIDYYKKQSIFFEVDGRGEEEEVNERLEDAIVKTIQQLRG